MKSLMQISALVVIATCHLTSAMPQKQNRSYRTEDNKGNYAFGYAINEGASSFHEESGSPGMKLGAYGVTEADGTQRVVNYIADENGFRASVEVKDQDPHQVTPGHHTVLVAQAQPVAVSAASLGATSSAPVATEAPAKTVEKKIAVRRIDEALSNHQKDEDSDVKEVESTSQTAPVSLPSGSSDPAMPLLVEPIINASDNGMMAQYSIVSQHLPLQVTPPRSQDLLAAVFFVPLPTQHMAAYSGVHSYSVNGLVPVPVVPLQDSAPSASSPQLTVSGKVPSFPAVKIQPHRFRAQIPQISPFQQVATLTSTRAQIQPYIPVFI
ncbi:uncharacterized protein LOC111247082 [Varroa destructor]|uniref:Cuticle protein 14 n=1 Tax=Varroa destructor TaxID=109461 RepID=A0A7M7MD65_VARDE|nr:uncharacterized protein LOC111247082 [Varroa destructor]